MADEVEIKLRVPRTALKTVEALDWLLALVDGPVKHKSLRSVYFDTPKRKLQQKGLTLRVRHAGKLRLQTVKAEGEGIFSRREWECEIEGDKPVLDALPPLKKLSVKKLRPVFETAVTRTVMPLKFNGTEVELALDRGTIKAARKQESISEIELELKDGDAAGLVVLAERLAKAIPAAYEVSAKSERGYALAAGQRQAPVYARAVALHEDMTVADAFRAIGKECLRHLASNEGAVITGETEGVHQMRVGLRRLRAAVSLFKEMLEDGESQALKAELKWLTEELAPARDLDVFMRETVAPLNDSAAEMAILQQDMEARRSEGFARAKAAVEGERYRRLVLAIALWLADGVWVREGDLLQRARRDRPVLSFAGEILAARLRKILKKAKKLERLEPHRRHKLRIAIKKLRYAGEYFASLYGGKSRREKMAGPLEELQDVLGRLNDFATHRKMAGEMVGHDGPKPKKAFAMGIVTGREQLHIETCLAAARKAGTRLKKQKPFWA